MVDNKAIKTASSHNLNHCGGVGTNLFSKSHVGSMDLAQNFPLFRKIR